ncbi:hypothetical protein PV04_09558 [Phialophora macrospora]|uniref:Zn(2)-C6 fungal-type domain-containing protein n=1 Tax=Phialophora macrospora TaxID=1851006 RepID=A0A0D2FCR6_9EURO|nr:hypothetical protein PV04_09558 [Phialophora macrospora]
MDANKALSSQRTSTRITFGSVTVLEVGHTATSAPKPRQIKDRSGCLACKRRRVKCDDARPTCKHCATRGEVCERAADVNQWRVSLSQPRPIDDAKACLGCKRRKLKCDPTLPSCRQCQRRNEPCQRPPPPGLVVVSALPRLPDSLVAERGIDLPHAHWDLLHDWCNRVCRILCNYGNDSNPLSFSVLETLTQSEAATHTLQSLSAGFQGHFNLPQATLSLEERSKAYICLRQEIDSTDRATEVILFTVIILGHSAGWLTDDTSEFGLHHLLAANTIIDGLLRDDPGGTKLGELFHLALGMFLYWDMTCSFLAPLEDLPTRNPLLGQVAKRMDAARPPHPVVGISSELLLVIGTIGRLCRRVWETDVRYPTAERRLESHLLEWQPPPETPELEHAIVAARCFRSTGLIMLYGLDQTTEREELLATQVEIVIENLKKIPVASPYYGFQAFVLSVVSSEVMDKDSRDFFVDQFHQLHNHNRLRANNQALQLVREIWARRDLGHKVTLPEVMGQKGWSVMLG